MVPVAAVYGCALLSFVLGYLVGRLDFIVGRSAGAHSAEQPIGTVAWNKSRAAEQSSAVAPQVQIDINDTKYVVPINTSGMQKASPEPLGKTTMAADNVNAAASRLAQLKGQ